MVVANISRRFRLALRNSLFTRFLQILIFLILCFLFVNIFEKLTNSKEFLPVQSSRVQSSMTLDYFQNSEASNQIIIRSKLERQDQMLNKNETNLIVDDMTRDSEPLTTRAKDMVKLESAQVRSRNYGIYSSSGGRLGNHLFQYASVYGIAKATGRIGYATPGVSIAEIFSKSIYSLEVKRPLDNVTELKEKFAGVFEEKLMKDLPQEDLNMCCYLQSWKYFVNSEKEIRSIFTFKPRTINQVTTIIEELSKNHIANIKKIYNNEIPLPNNHSMQEFKRKINLTSSDLTFVGIHIRQGDLLLSFLIEAGYKMASESYFKKAMDYFKKKYENVLFLLCSDDAERIKRSNKELFHSYDIEIVTRTGDIQDLALLSLCHHTIMSVGTFSWWAAWLAGGEVTYYKDWPQAKSNLTSQYNHDDYFLPQWIPIGD